MLKRIVVAELLLLVLAADATAGMIQGNRTATVHKVTHAKSRKRDCAPQDLHELLVTSANVNGVPYRCSAAGRWVIDDDAMTRQRHRQRERDELLAALTRRKLTRDELLRLTPLLNTREMEPYFAAVKYAEMYDLLITQWELKTETTLPIKTPLSRALGEYNRAPQEDDNRRAVENVIAALLALKD